MNDTGASPALVCHLLLPSVKTAFYLPKVVHIFKVAFVFVYFNASLSCMWLSTGWASGEGNILYQFMIMSRTKKQNYSKELRILRIESRRELGILKGYPPGEAGSLPRTSNHPSHLSGTCQYIDCIWRRLKTWGEWHKNQETGKWIPTTNNILTEKPLSPSSNRYSYFIPTKAVIER